MHFHIICKYVLICTALIVSLLSSAATECSTPIVISGNSSSPRPLTSGEPIALKPLGDQPTKIIITIYDHRLSNLLLTVAITELDINGKSWQINGKVGNYGRFTNKKRGNNLGFDQDYVKGEWMYLYINLDVKMKGLNVTEVKLKSRGGETTRSYKTRRLTSGSKAALVIGYKGNKVPFLVAWNCSYINNINDVSTTAETTTAILLPSTEMSYIQNISHFPKTTEISYMNTSYTTAIKNSTVKIVDTNLSLKQETKIINSGGCQIADQIPCSSFFFKWVGCSIMVLIVVILVLGITGQLNCYPNGNDTAWKH